MSSTQYFDRVVFNSMTGGSVYTNSLNLPSLTTTTTTDILYINETGVITKGAVPSSSISGSDTQLIFNQSGNYAGSNELYYDYTHNVLNSLGDLNLSSRVPHKFYTFTGSATVASSGNERLEVTLTFTQNSFLSKVTAILKNLTTAGTSILSLPNTVHDSTDVILIGGSYGEVHTSGLTGPQHTWDTSILIGDNTSATTIVFKSLEESSPITFDYQVLVETIGSGSLSSIVDNKGNSTTYTF